MCVQCTKYFKKKHGSGNEKENEKKHTKIIKKNTQNALEIQNT